MIDILFEVVLEFYMELMVLIVPEKNISPKQKAVIKVIAAVFTIGLLVMFVWGCGLVMENRIAMGVVLIVIPSVISIAQIIAGIVLYKKHH